MLHRAVLLAVGVLSSIAFSGTLEEELRQQVASVERAPQFGGCERAEYLDWETLLARHVKRIGETLKRDPYANVKLTASERIKFDNAYPPGRVQDMVEIREHTLEAVETRKINSLTGGEVAKNREFVYTTLGNGLDTASRQIFGNIANMTGDESELTNTMKDLTALLKDSEVAKKTAGQLMPALKSSIKAYLESEEAMPSIQMKFWFDWYRYVIGYMREGGKIAARVMTESCG